MQSLLITPKRLLIFLGTGIFILLVRKSLQQRNSLTARSSPCNYDRLPESLVKLNQMYNDVKTFVIFLGYSTPMESLTSAMLNAHPEIFIPQQYDIIGNWKMFHDNNLQDLGQQKYLLFFHLHYLSRYQSLFRNKANKPSQFWLWTYKGDIVPNFFVPDSRQESIKGKIKIIGDSSGLTTTMKLHGQNNYTVLKELQTVVGIPVKFVHLISNPFDTIAVDVKQANNSKEVRRAISTFFGLVNTNEDIRKNYGRAVLDVNTNDLKLRPRDTLKTICRFLDTKCDDSYLDGIEYLFRREILSKHRHLVKWTKDFNDSILIEMKKYSFLRPFLT